MGTPGLRIQRAAVWAVFFVNGLAIGMWAPHIPHIRETLELSEARLGLLLLLGGVGAVSAMPLAGVLSDRWGSDLVTRRFGTAMALVLPAVVLAPSPLLFGAASFAFGAMLGSMDIGMNSSAAEVEAQWGVPLMSGFHGMFSVGALVGAVATAGLLALEVGRPAQIVGGALVIGVVALVAPAGLPKGTGDTDEGGTFVFPRGKLLLLGVMGLIVFMAEGGATDWGAILLRDDLGASDSLATFGFAAFSATMALGRLVGDRINKVLGPERFLRWSALVGGAGLTLGLLVYTPWVVVAGFALLGAGLSNTVPLILSAGAANGITPGQGISAVATVGYFGFIVGAPLIGAVATASSLRTAMIGVAVLVLAVSTQAKAVRPLPK